jgi:hypothetical protein
VSSCEAGVPDSHENLNLILIARFAVPGSWREVLSFADQKSQLKTMQSIIKVGQRFKFTVLTDDRPSERQGVVIRVLSNREEGLGLDVDQYMSYWVEAHELPETDSSTTLVFVRSTDGKVYLDGKVTDVTLLP